MLDLDLAVIGGGAAGLTAAVFAAGAGARVALVERERTGGECLWTGCVPSKSLIETAALAHRMRHADMLGMTPVEPDIDLSHVLQRVRKAQAEIEPNDSPERLRGLGVQVVDDHAFFGPGDTLNLASGGRLRARSVLLATGSEPTLPPVEGIAASQPLTTDTVWDLEELPSRLLVLGGGPVGCELAQAFARLGASVTLVEIAPQLLPSEDPDTGELVAERLAADGVDVRTGARVERIDDDKAEIHGDDRVEHITHDRVLVAAGRRPRTDGLGLAEVGVRLTGTGAVIVDARLRTTARHIYAAGDVTGILPLTHVASYQARTATLNALFGLRRKASYGSIPRVTFTDPEIARVGCTETEARQRWGSRATAVRIDYAAVDRAVTAASTNGFVKLVGSPRGRLVGAVIAAPAGGEFIGELAALVARGARVEDIYRTVHPYPTFALGAEMAGGEHLRARKLSDRKLRLARSVLRVNRAISGWRTGAT